jgi:hypothetical protein
MSNLPSSRTTDNENSGGAFGVLVIAIPISLVLWAIVIYVLLNFVH